MSHRLHQHFDDLVGAAIVDQVIEEELGRFKRARVESFVPVLVERAARQRLAAIAAGPRRYGHDRAEGVSAKPAARVGGPGHSPVSAAAGGNPAGGGEPDPIDAVGPEGGTSGSG